MFIANLRRAANRYAIRSYADYIAVEKKYRKQYKRIPNSEKALMHQIRMMSKYATTTRFIGRTLIILDNRLSDAIQGENHLGSQNWMQRVQTMLGYSPRT